MKPLKLCLACVALLACGCQMKSDIIGGWDKHNEPASTITVNPFTGNVNAKIAADTKGRLKGNLVKKPDGYLKLDVDGDFESRPSETMLAQGERAAMLAPLFEIQRQAWGEAERNFGQNIALIMATAGDQAPKIAAAYADFLSARAASMSRNTAESDTSLRDMIREEIKAALKEQPTP